MCVLREHLNPAARTQNINHWSNWNAAVGEPWTHRTDLCVRVCYHSPRPMKNSRVNIWLSPKPPRSTIRCTKIHKTEAQFHSGSILIWNPFINISPFSERTSTNIHSFITRTFPPRLKLLICERSSRTKCADPWLSVVRAPSAIFGQFCWLPNVFIHNTHPMSSIQRWERQHGGR